MSNATQAVVDGKLEPMTKSEPAPQLVVTGQYLADTFLKSSESDITRMSVIRDLAGKADSLQIKGATDKMVEIGRKEDLAAGLPEKEMRDGKEKRTRGSREQQAMNARTIILQAWGAIKFASKECDSQGYTDQTGYYAMRVIAQAALKSRGIDWKGEPVKTEKDREVAAARREQKAETELLTATMQSNPREKDESYSDYLARCAKLSETAINTARREAEQKAVDIAVASILEKHGTDRALSIALALMDKIGVSVGDGEPSEAEVAARMAKVDENLQPA